MSVLGASSTHRRRLIALALASALTAGVAGADLVSTASQAIAGTAPGTTTASARTPASAPTSAGVPVSVPADVPFHLDVVPVTVTADPAAAGTVQEVAAATLAQLPGSGGVVLTFDRPELAGHLGGVFMNRPGEILVSASRLTGRPGQTADVVRHEMAHVYQARLATTRGLRTVNARMVELFGPNGLERAADCVAVAFGATWTQYPTDCAGPERVAAVQALIEGRMP
ncbi:hypothetical protein [Cellulomonas aerilata]|nr:hypothetical protein [Cellulomonas aerilata]